MKSYSVWGCRQLGTKVSHCVAWAVWELFMKFHVITVDYYTEIWTSSLCGYLQVPTFPLVCQSFSCRFPNGWTSHWRPLFLATTDQIHKLLPLFFASISQTHTLPKTYPKHLHKKLFSVRPDKEVRYENNILDTVWLVSETEQCMKSLRGKTSALICFMNWL